MRRWLFDLLICPDCSEERPLEVTSGKWESDRLTDGILGCTVCGGRWPVRGGMPHFVPEERDYAGVIQHTPDPERTMRAMPRLLKRGAPLGYNFYELTWGRRVSEILSEEGLTHIVSEPGIVRARQKP